MAHKVFPPVRKKPLYLVSMHKTLLFLFSITTFLSANGQSTKSLVSEVSLDSLIKTVREFSGEDSAVVNDSTVRIVHRVSKRGNNLAADYLVGRLKAYGLKVETIDYRNGGRNVVGTLVGKTNPDSVFFISAHYDAVADYCADDNASGSATVLEAARIMSQYCFHNTIKFAFWDEEELGLIGSRYYADSANARGDFIAGVLNMDMMGYDGDSNKVFDIHTNSNPENQRLKDTVLFVLDTLNIDLVPNVINPGTTRSDHAAFWKHRYPAVFCGESFIGGDPNPAYHSAKDRINLFDLPYYHKLAQLAIGVVVELTNVIPTAVEHDTVVACHAYVYSDSTFRTSTVYADSLQTDLGCDSVFVLHLTVLPEFLTIDTIQACGEYVYRNESYTKSGTYHDTLVARNGCDSVYTMDLTVFPIPHVTDTIVVCHSYSYRGETIELSGIYHDTLTSYLGCDSFYTFHLTVLPVYKVTDVIDVCTEHLYRGQSFTTSGVYRDTLTSRNGCDSVYTMDLTIRNTVSRLDTISSCGDYTYRNQVYMNDGVYHDTLVAQNGCDSFYSFDLRITRINDSIFQGTNTLTAVDTTAQYQWMTCDLGVNYQKIDGATNRTFNVLLDNWYSLVLTKNQCTDTSACIPVTLTHVPQVQTNQFAVYPNPSTGRITINSRVPCNATVYVRAMNGVDIGIYQFNGQQKMQLNLPEQSGLFVVQVVTDEGNETFKVLKIE